VDKTFFGGKVFFKMIRISVHSIAICSGLSKACEDCIEICLFN